MLDLGTGRHSDTTSKVSHAVTACPLPQVGSCQSQLEPSCSLLKVLPLNTGPLWNRVTLTWGSAEQERLGQSDKLGVEMKKGKVKRHTRRHRPLKEAINKIRFVWICFIISIDPLKVWKLVWNFTETLHIRFYWLEQYRPTFSIRCENRFLIEGSMIVSPWLIYSRFSSWKTSSPVWGELPGWPPAELCPLPCGARQDRYRTFSLWLYLSLSIIYHNL